MNSKLALIPSGITASRSYQSVLLPTAAACWVPSQCAPELKVHPTGAVAMLALIEEPQLPEPHATQTPPQSVSPDPQTTHVPPPHTCPTGHTLVQVPQ